MTQPPPADKAPEKTIRFGDLSPKLNQQEREQMRAKLERGEPVHYVAPFTRVTYRVVLD